MKKALNDPFAKREAQKYENPIPSRECILKLLKQAHKPMTRKEIAASLVISDEERWEALRRRLKAMERDGQILKNRKKCYFVINSKDLVTGRVIGHADGFGFLKPDDGSEDLFISPREMNKLFHNDRAVVSVMGIDRRGRRESSVVEVLERNTQQIVGRLISEGEVFSVIPDNKNISHLINIPHNACGDAKHNQIVVVEIVEQPSSRRQPIGRVVEILGDHMAPGMEIEMAIRSFDLPFQWPEAVKQEIAQVEKTLHKRVYDERVDLRATPLVTIDGEDARDFDDAVFCKKTPNGWKLLVAIADVSSYVTADAALDNEAKNRGTSVYFPEKVIPMLPEALSNNLCSLVPKEDRLCLVCEMSINSEGQVIRSRFFDAVMCSHARLTYTEVFQMLVEEKKSVRKKYRELLPHLSELYKLYAVLRVARETRGAIDFDSQETKILYGDNKKIEKVIPLIRNDAHRMIEEFMILANITAAKFLAKKKIPHLLRIHDGPTTEKLIDLRSFLGGLGLHLGGGNKPSPQDYKTLTELIEDRKDSQLIQSVLLRSFSQAVYSPEKKGHFGLALEHYTHFTSPIRRYPDLLIHRGIKHAIRKNSKASFNYSDNDMNHLGEHCSATERRADDATRAVVLWLKCEYMLDKLGERFQGIISAVTSFGFFVELNDIFIEGLVHITTIGRDYFHFDPISHRLQGERTGVTYQLGDKVTVMVAKVDLDEKKIDFELDQAKSKTTKSKTTKRLRKAKRKK